MQKIVKTWSIHKYPINIQLKSRTNWNIFPEIKWIWMYVKGKLQEPVNHIYECCLFCLLSISGDHLEYLHGHIWSRNCVPVIGKCDVSFLGDWWWGGGAPPPHPHPGGGGGGSLMIKSIDTFRRRTTEEDSEVDGLVEEDQLLESHPESSNWQKESLLRRNAANLNKNVVGISTIVNPIKICLYSTNCWSG